MFRFCEFVLLQPNAALDNAFAGQCSQSFDGATIEHDNTGQTTTTTTTMEEKRTNKHNAVESIDSFLANIQFSINTEILAYHG